MRTVTLITLGKETAVHYLLALGCQLQKQGLNVILGAAPAFQPLARRVGISFQPLEETGGRFSAALLQQVQRLAEKSCLIAVHKPYLSVIQALGPLPCPVVGVALQAGEILIPSRKKERFTVRIASWMKRNRRKSLGTFIPTLYNFSPQLLAGRKGQAAHPPLTGYWAIPDSLRWRLYGKPPCPALSDWMYRGGRPVFFDFSAAPEAERGRLLNMVKSLSERMGFRALICSAWAGLKEGLWERDIYCLNTPVQEWLFQQCAAAIHYGQTDMLPEAVRAGAPNILCAAGTEANAWGELLRRHGIGIHLRKGPPTAAVLEQALEEALRLSMQYKAKAMGKALQEEKGLEVAAEAICRQVGREAAAMAV